MQSMLANNKYGVNTMPLICDMHPKINTLPAVSSTGLRLDNLTRQLSSTGTNQHLNKKKNGVKQEQFEQGSFLPCKHHCFHNMFQYAKTADICIEEMSKITEIIFTNNWQT